MQFHFYLPTTTSIPSYLSSLLNLTPCLLPAHQFTNEIFLQCMSSQQKHNQTITSSQSKTLETELKSEGPQLNASRHIVPFFVLQFDVGIDRTGSARFWTTVSPIYSTLGQA